MPKVGDGCLPVSLGLSSQPLYRRPVVVVASVPLLVEAQFGRAYLIYKNAHQLVGFSETLYVAPAPNAQLWAQSC